MKTTNPEIEINIHVQTKPTVYLTVVLSFGLLLGLIAVSLTSIGVWLMIMVNFPPDSIPIILLFLTFLSSFLYTLKLWIEAIWGKEIVLFRPNEIQVIFKNKLFRKGKTYQIDKIENFRIKVSKTNTLESNSLEKNPFAAKIKRIGLNKNITITRFQFDYGQKNVRIAEGISEADANSIMNYLIDRKILLQENFADSNDEYFVKI